MKVILGFALIIAFSAITSSLVAREYTAQVNGLYQYIDHEIRKAAKR